MIDFLFTVGAAAETKTRYAAPARPAASKPSLLPKRCFDDSQDCLTFLKRQMAAFGNLRVSLRCSEGTEQPVPWRSL